VSDSARLVLRIYRLLLTFYPVRFQHEFGVEMTTIFTQVMMEAPERGKWSVLAVTLRELREMPLNLAREHWHALTKKEFPMNVIGRPQWYFYPAWVLLTVLCFPAAFIFYMAVIGFITDIIGDIIYVNGVRRITEDYLGMYIIIPVLGLLTGCVQYLLLRRYLPRMGWWVLATFLGWILGVILLAGWLSLDIVSFPFGRLDLTFLVIGLAVGIGQWLLLRRRIPRAGWWVVASLLGWGSVVLITGVYGNPSGISASIEVQLIALGLMPACVTAVMMGLLLNQAQPAEAQVA
jgi:hypothetical protein